MEPFEGACPTCGGAETRAVDAVWDSRQVESNTAATARIVAPPVPRAAATNAGTFYAVGFVGLVAWVLGAVYLCSLVAAHASAVFFVACVAVAGGLLQIVRLFTGTPKPTADQLAALDEWKTAHREWQQKRICLRCEKTFSPSGTDPPTR